MPDKQDSPLGDDYVEAVIAIVRELNTRPERLSKIIATTVDQTPECVAYAMRAVFDYWRLSKITIDKESTQVAVDEARMRMFSNLTAAIAELDMTAAFRQALQQEQEDL